MFFERIRFTDQVAVAFRNVGSSLVSLAWHLLFQQDRCPVTKQCGIVVVPRHWGARRVGPGVLGNQGQMLQGHATMCTQSIALNYERGLSAAGEKLHSGACFSGGGKSAFIVRCKRQYCRLNRPMNADFPPPGKICMHLNAVFLRRRKVRVHSSIQTAVPVRDIRRGGRPSVARQPSQAARPHSGGGMWSRLCPTMTRTSQCRVSRYLLHIIFSLFMIRIVHSQRTIFPDFGTCTRADNFVLVKFGFSALSVPRFFGV